MNLYVNISECVFEINMDEEANISSGNSLASGHATVSIFMTSVIENSQEILHWSWSWSQCDSLDMLECQLYSMNPIEILPTHSHSGPANRTGLLSANSQNVIHWSCHQNCPLSVFFQFFTLFAFLAAAALLAACFFTAAAFLSS